MIVVLKGNYWQASKKKRLENAFHVLLIWFFDTSVQENQKNSRFLYGFIIM